MSPRKKWFLFFSILATHILHLATFLDQMVAKKRLRNRISLEHWWPMKSDCRSTYVCNILIFLRPVFLARPFDIPIKCYMYTVLTFDNHPCIRSPAKSPASLAIKARPGQACRAFGHACQKSTAWKSQSSPAKAGLLWPPRQPNLGKPGLGWTFGATMATRLSRAWKFHARISWLSWPVTYWPKPLSFPGELVNIWIE